MYSKAKTRALLRQPMPILRSYGGKGETNVGSYLAFVEFLARFGRACSLSYKSVSSHPNNRKDKVTVYVRFEMSAG